MPKELPAENTDSARCFPQKPGKSDAGDGKHRNLYPAADCFASHTAIVVGTLNRRVHEYIARLRASLWVAFLGEFT